ncbi:MAG TPA: metallopeptidase family protein [Kofleriaceae bacterium]|nr:metallopeptidase family protein [Kofleriaceae bacterium]
MSRQDRLSADLERGFTALEEGRIDDAVAACERVQRVDRKDPNVMALAAACADAQGDAEAALKVYRELIEATPDDPMPRICAARIELRDEGNPEAALDTLEKAFNFIDEERDLVEAILVRTEALIALDALADARESLSELASSVIDEPVLALDLAELALAAEDPSSAARYIEIAKADPELAADALHLLGRVHELRDERAPMIAAWKQVRALDAAAPLPTVSISEDEVERIAVAALELLPPEVRAKLENVPILIDDVPSEALVEDGTDPRLLGLFSGSPMTDGLAPVVTNIHLFKRNLERAAHDLDELAAEITITVLHETAHYFGLEEDDLEALGLD